MNKRPLVLIKDNWALNLGDVAIAESMIEQIKSLYPNSEIILESSHPEVTKQYFSKITIIPRLFDISSAVHTGKLTSISFVSKNAILILSIFLKIIYSYVMISLKVKTNNPALYYYKNADLILSAGGDFISEAYAWQLRMYEIYLIKKIGKPLILYGQSIGPFSKRNSLIVKRYLNMVDAIFARDERTYSLLKKYGVKSKVFLTADCVILLKKKNTEKIRKYLERNSINKKSVGIVIRDRKYMNITENEYEQYFNNIKKFVKYCKSHEVTIVLIAPNHEDLMSAKKLKNEAKIKCSIFNTQVYRPSEVKSALSKFKVLISSRMHPIIIASTAGTPVIGIGHEFKMRSYLSLIGLEDYYIDMTSLTEKKLILMYEDLLNNYQRVRGDMQQEIKKLEKRSKLNISYTKDIVNSYDFE